MCVPPVQSENRLPRQNQKINLHVESMTSKEVSQQHGTIIKYWQRNVKFLDKWIIDLSNLITKYCNPFMLDEWDSLTKGDSLIIDSKNPKIVYGTKRGFNTVFLKTNINNIVNKHHWKFKLIEYSPRADWGLVIGISKASDIYNVKNSRLKGYGIISNGYSTHWPLDANQYGKSGKYFEKHKRIRKGYIFDMFLDFKNNSFQVSIDNENIGNCVEGIISNGTYRLGIVFNSENKWELLEYNQTFGDVKTV
eukprot:463903_1